MEVSVVRVLSGGECGEGADCGVVLRTRPHAEKGWVW